MRSTRPQKARSAPSPPGRPSTARSAAPPAGRSGRARDRSVQRLPHLGRDHVAQGCARARGRGRRRRRSMPGCRCRASAAARPRGAEAARRCDASAPARPRRRASCSPVGASPGAGGLAPMIASTPSQLSAIPAVPVTPATSAWKAPSSMRAVCSPVPGRGRARTVPERFEPASFLLFCRAWPCQPP